VDKYCSEKKKGGSATETGREKEAEARVQTFRDAFTAAEFELDSAKAAVLVVREKLEAVNSKPSSGRGPSFRSLEVEAERREIVSELSKAEARESNALVALKNNKVQTPPPVLIKNIPRYFQFDNYFSLINFCLTLHRIGSKNHTRPFLKPDQNLVCTQHRLNQISSSPSMILILCLPNFVCSCGTGH